MLYCNIDLTDPEYENIQGKVETVDQLKDLLFKDDTDKVGYIRAEDWPQVSICIAVQNGLGVYVGIKDGKELHLSLEDADKLHEVFDVWGDDGMFISKGLFIRKDLAWKCIKEYLTKRSLCSEARWITPREIPEDGNYISL